MIALCWALSVCCDSSQAQAHPSCGGLAAYQNLQQAFVERDTDKLDLEAARCFIANERYYQAFTRHLQLAASRDGWWAQQQQNLACWVGVGCQDNWLEAYRIFISRAANFDVALEYVRNGLQHALQDAAVRKALRGNVLAWRGASIAMGGAELLRRTESPELADILQEYFDGVLELRDSELGEIDPLRGRVTSAWSSTVRPENVRTSHAPLAGRITFPMLDFADIVLRSEKLARFHSKAQQYIEASAQALREFDEDWKPVDGGRFSYYVMPTRGTVEPINHVHAVGNALVLLYKHTQDQGYRDKIEEIVRVFLSSVTEDANGTLQWPYYPAWAMGDQPSEPMWKGAVTAPFLYLAYKEGFVDAQTITKIRLTLLRNVMLGDGLNARISLTDQEAIDVNKDAGRAQNIFFWLQMLSDASIPAFADVMAENPALFPNGWLSSGKTFAAYARMITMRDVRRASHRHDSLEIPGIAAQRIDSSKSKTLGLR